MCGERVLRSSWFWRRGDSYNSLLKSVAQVNPLFHFSLSFSFIPSLKSNLSPSAQIVNAQVLVPCVRCVEIPLLIISQHNNLTNLHYYIIVAKVWQSDCLRFGRVSRRGFSFRVILEVCFELSSEFYCLLIKGGLKEMTMLVCLTAGSKLDFTSSLQQWTVSYHTSYMKQQESCSQIHEHKIQISEFSASNSQLIVSSSMPSTCWSVDYWLWIREIIYIFSSLAYRLIIKD